MTSSTKLIPPASMETVMRTAMSAPAFFPSTSAALNPLSPWRWRLCSTEREPLPACSTWQCHSFKQSSKRFAHVSIQRRSSSLPSIKASVEGGEDSAEDGQEGVGAAVKDWREFRARLVKKQEGVTGSNVSWAHPLAAPETGCILLAHPTAFGARQQYFHQAVIFIFAHGDDEGTAGIILNRPTEYTLGQLAGFEELHSEFSTCPLYMGGDVGSKSTHVLHSHGELKGAKEIISGVYVGGYSALKEHVTQGLSSPMDYRWFARYSGWGPGQLEREVAAGVWFLASCSKDLILKHTVDLKTPLWRETMELMGGEYASLAKKSYGEV